MKNIVATFLFFALMTFVAQGFSQSAEVFGAISGQVVCNDTNAPARFGRVLLRSINPNSGPGEAFSRHIDNMLKADTKSGQPAKSQTEEQRQVDLRAKRAMNRAFEGLGSTTIGLNGNYSFAHIKPGTYYVHVMLAGYVDPLGQFSDDEMESTDPAIRVRIAAAIPTVTISGSEPVHLDLRLDRGASITGQVLFDDGSPAPGWVVSVMNPNEKNDASNPVPMSSRQIAMGVAGGALTDDLGNYRISGLAKGQYLLGASLTATGLGISSSNIRDNGTGIQLVVYANDALHRSSAKPITLTEGEARAGVNILIPSHSLHGITGHVASKADAHLLNSGQVTLTSKDNPGLRLRAAIREDGTFHYDYLPPDTYSLKVDSAADVRVTGSSSILGMTVPKEDTLHKYGSASIDVLIADSDVDSVQFALTQTDWTPPAKTPGKEVSPAAALGSLFGSILSGDDAEDKPKDAPK